MLLASQDRRKFSGHAKSSRTVAAFAGSPLPASVVAYSAVVDADDVDEVVRLVAMVNVVYFVDEAAVGGADEESSS